jgi:hypothetical protein
MSSIPRKKKIKKKEKKRTERERIEDRGGDSRGKGKDLGRMQRIIVFIAFIVFIVSVLFPDILQYNQNRLTDVVKVCPMSVPPEASGSGLLKRVFQEKISRSNLHRVGCSVHF